MSVLDEINKLEEQLFQINMIDHWTNEDSHNYDRVYNKQRRLKELVGWNTKIYQK